MLGLFDLEPGQSLQLEFTPPESRYWSVTLESIWHECLEPLVRQSSVTNKGVAPGTRRPGATHHRRQDRRDGFWLDTGGRRRGFITLRWLDNRKALTSRFDCWTKGNSAMTRIEASAGCRQADRAGLVSSPESDDFGDDDGWRGNLDRLLEDFIAEADLSPLGVEIAAADVILPLRNRLRGITAWRNEHPETAGERIEQTHRHPGSARTGTTILRPTRPGPDLRVPLTWRSANPSRCHSPTPTTPTRGSPHPGATREMTEQLMPGFMKFHPMSARTGQVCAA